MKYFKRNFIGLYFTFVINFITSFYWTCFKVYKYINMNICTPNGECKPLKLLML